MMSIQEKRNFEEDMKAIEAAGKKIKGSKKEARKFLVMAGILDKKGNFTPRYRRTDE